MGYLIRTSNSLERIAFSNPTYMISIIDLMATGVETPRIDNGLFLEKELTKLIHMNPCMVLYQTVNQVDYCHNCICGPWT